MNQPLRLSTKPAFLACLIANVAFGSTPTITQITADQVTTHQAKHQIIYTGHVTAMHGSSRLHAERLILEISPQSHHITQMRAYGQPATLKETNPVTHQVTHGQADSMRYDIQADMIYLHGNAIVKKHNADIRAPSIRYNRKTNTAYAQPSHNHQQRIHIHIAASQPIAQTSP